MWSSREYEARAAETLLGISITYRAGPSGTRQVKSLMNHCCQIGHVSYEIVVLNARTRDSHGINFLKGISTDERQGNLAVTTTIGVESI